MKFKMFAALLFTIFNVGLISAVSADVALPTRDMPLEITENTELGKLDEGVGLSVGTKVPNFSSVTHDGIPVTLNDLLVKGQLMVVFYRGGWCPFCNTQIRELTEAWPEFKKRDITPVLISVDKTDGAALAQRTYEIPFPVLSDSSLAAHEALNVILELDEKTYERYKTYGIDVEQWSGEKHHKIAVAAVYVLDEKGVVQWAHASKSYKVRPSSEQLLTVIDGLSEQ